MSTNNNNNIPVAKRTPLQTQCLYQGSHNQTRKRKSETWYGDKQVYHEVIDVDADDDVNQDDDGLDEKFKGNGSALPFKTEEGAYIIIRDGSDEEQEGFQSQDLKRKRETCNGVKHVFHEVIDVDAAADVNSDHDGLDFSYGSALPFKTEEGAYIIFPDGSDEEQEESNEDVETSYKHHNGTQNNAKAGVFQSSEYESSSSSDSEAVDIFSLLKIPNYTTAEEKKISENTTDEAEFKEEESDLEESVYSLDNLDQDDGIQENEKESSVQTTDDDDDDEYYQYISSSESDDTDDSDYTPERKRPHKSTHNGKRPMNEPCDTAVDVNQKAKEPKDHYTKVVKTNSVKYKKYKKGVGRDDDIDAILDSIINHEDVHVNKEDGCLPLKFRFDDSEEEDLSKKIHEYNGEDLFEEMEFALTCAEAGPFSVPKSKNKEKEGYYEDIDLCKIGQHDDVYYDEEIGSRCGLCGAILLETKFVIPTGATYAPDRSKRSRRYDEEQFCNLENPYRMDPNSNSNIDMCKQTKGTVWELIPASIQAHMYPHQQEGFEFLWKNVAGTIELSRLQILNPRGDSGHGGGCIISHAPGTGKTFLTIVFLESFLKKFPKCCPLIVAPASMLLTWEAEFKKWEVGFSFINLQNITKPLRKEMIIGSSRNNIEYIRAMKIHAWIKGGHVLGVSYNLFEKLAGNSNNKNTRGERVRTCLLDMPGIVVLDEGHTPRNENSNIWKVLLKLKTKKRVILSGTPFQNNFEELFNTLRLSAMSTEKEKSFSDMIHTRNSEKFRCTPTSEGVEKLKENISPFVHVYKGHILERQLPGLKRSVVVLKPSPCQNGLIEKLNLKHSAINFECDYKVALVSVHPSLILRCQLTKEEAKLINKQELEDVRLEPEVGVKTRFVMELIHLSLSLNEKVLIFSQYIRPSELLQEQIALLFRWDVDREITLIKGNISQSRRQKIINDFNDPKSELKVLLASTKCCFEGIHLYGASRVVLLDIVWNPSVERQAISRAYRLGQKKVVYTYHLLAAGTTEEKKYNRQVEKWQLAEQVFSSASEAGEEAKKKVNVDDMILLEMVGNQQLKDIFQEIRYPEN